MDRNVPYYSLDEDEHSEASLLNGEAYIDDGDLKDLLIDLLGDEISDEEIQKILDASNDEDLSEEDFDKLVDEFILKNKK